VIPGKDPDCLGNAMRMNWSLVPSPLIFLPVGIILPVLRKFESEGKSVLMIVPKWKGQVWSPLLDKLTVNSCVPGNAEDILIAGKRMIKRNRQLPPGFMEARLLKNTLNPGEYSVTIHQKQANPLILSFSTTKSRYSKNFHQIGLRY
jgi:hypothetical protein